MGKNIEDINWYILLELGLGRIKWYVINYLKILECFLFKYCRR